MPLWIESRKEDLGWQQASLPSRNPITRWVWGYQLLRNFDNPQWRSIIGGWYIGVRGVKTLVDPRQGWKFRPNG
jgi:hypothetical protein